MKLLVIALIGGLVCASAPHNGRGAGPGTVVAYDRYCVGGHLPNGEPLPQICVPSPI